MYAKKNQEKINKINFEIFPVYISDVLKKMHKTRQKEKFRAEADAARRGSRRTACRKHEEFHQRNAFPFGRFGKTQALQTALQTRF